MAYKREREQSQLTKSYECLKGGDVHLYLLQDDYPIGQQNNQFREWKREYWEQEWDNGRWND